MRTLALLGATGSIGASALDVVARHPDRFRIGALAAHRNVDALVELCRRFRPALAVIADPAGAAELRARLAAAQVDCRVEAGPEALIEAAVDARCDTVVAAIVGAAGLESTLAAARAGKRLLLANKEAVVMAGPLLLAALAAGGGELLPIDSEHNAMFQCLPGGRPDLAASGVRRILLTASGGPFRGRSRAELARITPDQACAHPNWRMGRKISVDSATLMNKGLEVIEAHWLFAAPAERIEVVVHAQSVVHSLVEYVDGSVLAQLGNPDMRTALAHALAWPERVDAGVAALDLAQGRAPGFRGAGPRHLPLPRPRLPCARRRRYRRHGAQRGQRRGGGGVPRRPLPFLAIAETDRAQPRRAGNGAGQRPAEACLTLI